MIHQLDDGNYVISSRNVWLPGVYDSRRTANYAFRFNTEVLERLQEPGGVITYDMLADSKPKFSGAGKNVDFEVGDSVSFQMQDYELGVNN